MVAKVPLVYLAAPYMHPSDEIRQARYRVTTIAAARMIREGINVYSPVTMGHAMVLDSPDGRAITQRRWIEHAFKMLEKCDRLWVLKLAGWDRSAGVQAEMEFFRQYTSRTTSLHAPAEWVNPQVLGALTRLEIAHGVEG